MTTFGQLEENIIKECRWEKDPSTLRSAFADLTRLHYSDPNNITSQDIPRLKNYIWDPDPARSKIYIDVAGKFDPKIVETRPAIFVGISDTDFTREVFRNEASQDFTKGETNYAIKNSCSVLLHHVGTVVDEALALARITAAYYTAFTQMLRKEFNFNYLHVSKLSRPAILYEAKERWISTVYIDLQYFETWQVATESHKLKAIKFTTEITNA